MTEDIIKQDGDSKTIELTFLNYITSLIYQSMIFLGQVPNPMNDNKIDRNLEQAKLLIDTLSVLEEKTKGNLTQEEEKVLKGAVYELRMKYSECVKP